MGPSISLDLTVDDLIAYNLHGLRSEAIRRQMRRARLLALVMLILVMVCAVVAAIAGSTGVCIVLLVMAACFVCGILMLPRYAAWALPRRLRAMIADGLTPAPRPSRLWVDDSGGVVDESADRTTWYAPTAIERIEETPDHVFLFVGPGQALVIPRRIGEPAVQGLLHALNWHRAQRAGAVH